MKPSPEYSSDSQFTSAIGPRQPAQAATMVYQAVTIVAMLLLLCSMWVF
jgi:hypothetical protein